MAQHGKHTVTQATGQNAAGGRRYLKRSSAVAIFAVTAVVIIVLDRITKAWAVSSIPSGGLPGIPGIIGFKLVYNKGASFGVLEGATALFLIICIVMFIAIIIYLLRYKRHVWFEVIALGGVAAGALGNAFDRIVYGQVTDFLSLQFIDFPVFNVADCGITIGIVVWLLFMLFHPASPAGLRDKKQLAPEGAGPAVSVPKDATPEDATPKAGDDDGR